MNAPSIRTRRRALPLTAAAALTLAACHAPDAAPEAALLAPGSTRGSVVALDPATVAGPLVYLTSAMDEAQAEAAMAAHPGAIEIVYGLDRASALEQAPRAHGVDAHLVDDAFLAAAPNLRWMQSWSAGVERYVGLDGLAARPEVVLTNAKGVHGPVIAEHVFALLLDHVRGLADYREAQTRGAWERNAAPTTTSLAGRTLLVAGMGGIGSEVAQRARAFDMRVLATVRSERPKPDYVDVLATGDRLDELLAETDVLVICLPLTDETRGLFNARSLGLLRPGAFVVNIARGPILDSGALLAGLETGRIGGAFLDVTDPEPLPSDHPLWRQPNVTITPHVAGRAELTGERRDALVRANIARFVRGEPLYNVVDRDAGY